MHKMKHCTCNIQTHLHVEGLISLGVASQSLRVMSTIRYVHINLPPNNEGTIECHFKVNNTSYDNFTSNGEQKWNKMKEMGHDTKKE